MEKIETSKAWDCDSRKWDSVVIKYSTNLWTLTAWKNRAGTLIHINRIDVYSVGRPEKNFPPFADIEQMTDEAFNEMCRVSWHETSNNPF